MALLGQLNTAPTGEVRSARGGHEREIVGYRVHCFSKK